MKMKHKLNEISSRLDRNGNPPDLLTGSLYQLEESAALQRYSPNMDQRRYKTGRPLQCWNCGRYGHVARLCRARNQWPLTGGLGPGGRREARQTVWLNEQGSSVMAQRSVHSKQLGH
ncbi:hypothetical protein M513_07845 [Trichuris suis]|uniref:CCHC-type domain-containing protein n=2 Tax=Trichuris suis TaxID=68888 RepID=A0A085M1Z9_9BILA|nr:hypothetical protein M513_07845 [Trichuris suis]